MIYLSDFHKWGLFGFRASVVNVLRLENTIFQCVSIQNVQKQQNVTAWHNHKSDHNSGIRQKLACPRIVLQSLSPSGVVELIFSGTRLIFLKLIYFFPHYHSEEIAPRDGVLKMIKKNMYFNYRIKSPFQLERRL